MSVGLNSFDHVLPAMQQYLTIEGRARVGACWENIWVTTPGVTEAFKAIGDCITNSDATKPNGVAITGEPDTGKTHILTRFAMRQTPSVDQSQEYSQHPAICVVAPSKPDFPVMLERILEELGHSGIYNQSADMTERYVKRLMKRCGVKLVLADELLDIDNNPKMQARTLEFLGLLKNFINTTHRPIAVSGVPELLELLKRDEQIYSRFDTRVTLKPMTLAQFAPVVLAYEKQLPLRKPSNFQQNEEILTHLFLNCAGYIGRLSRHLSRACRVAIESKEERLTLQILEHVQDDSVQQAA